MAADFSGGHVLVITCIDVDHWPVLLFRPFHLLYLLPSMRLERSQDTKKPVVREPRPPAKRTRWATLPPTITLSPADPLAR